MLKVKIKSITDFGIFIGPGRRHRRPWFTCLTSPGTLQAKKQFVNTKKATKSLQLFCRLTQNVNVSPLGVKQLAEDPFNNWVALNKKGAIVTGKVTAVDAKGATVELADGVEGYLRASEASRDRVEDATPGF